MTRMPFHAAIWTTACLSGLTALSAHAAEPPDALRARGAYLVHSMSCADCHTP